jgi:dCTP deaminase
MILCDTEILTLIKRGVICDADLGLVNPASLDVRLGPNLMIESAATPDMVPISIKRASQSDPYELVPGQFVLAETIELFNMPDHLSAQFALKSSRAGKGCSICLRAGSTQGFMGRG